MFTTWRLWFALPPLAVIVAVRRRSHPVMLRPPEVSRVRWALLVLGAGAFFASAAGSAFVAIDKTRLLDVALIGALQPVLIVAVAVLFLGERVDRRLVFFGALAVGGTVVVASASSGSGSWSLAGEIVAVVSLFLNAGWYLYGRVLRSRYAVDPFAFMLGVLTAAALLMTPVAAVELGHAADDGRRILVGGGDDGCRHERARAPRLGASLRPRVGVGTVAARGAAARRAAARGSASESRSVRSRSLHRSSSLPRSGG